MRGAASSRLSASTIGGAGGLRLRDERASSADRLASLFGFGHRTTLFIHVAYNPGAGNFAHSSRISPAMRVERRLVAAARRLHAAIHPRAICFISASPMPRLVTAGVPRRMPDGSNGLRGSNGTEL